MHFANADCESCPCDQRVPWIPFFSLSKMYHPVVQIPDEFGSGKALVVRLFFVSSLDTKLQSTK